MKWFKHADPQFHLFRRKGTNFVSLKSKSPISLDILSSVAETSQYRLECHRHFNFRISVAITVILVATEAWFQYSVRFIRASLIVRVLNSWVSAKSFSFNSIFNILVILCIYSIKELKWHADISRSSMQMYILIYLLSLQWVKKLQVSGRINPIGNGFY